MNRHTMTTFGALICMVFFAMHARSVEDTPPFKQAIEPRAFSFPADHASHAGYQTEWWYVTGNLIDEKGHEFGYQFTIFRRAMDPKNAKERGRTSAWAADDFYLLHLAISDIHGNVHADFEALERGVLGVAGATDVASVTTVSQPSSRVRTKNASFERYTRGWRLAASSARIGMELELVETMEAPVLHGKIDEAGLSRKGPKPGQASYYYSVPRLATTGTLTLDGTKYTIKEGRSWMDHEFGSNQLSPDQAGWEWFAIQLDDKSVLMLYVLRNKDGSIEPNSSGTIVNESGVATHFSVAESMFQRGRIWKSPHTGAEYPLEWTLKIGDVELRIKPLMDDQEFHSEQGAGMNYYEGAIRVEGTQNGKAVTGRGYLEITGKSLGGRM